MITEKQLSGLIQNFLRGSDKFLIEVVIKASNHIMVFIDGDHGVTIDDCKGLSRYLEQNLDRETEDFDLVVSSAGADRPLKIPRQYLRYIGKKLEVAAVNGTKAEGLVLAANDEGIKLEVEIKKSKKEIVKNIMALSYVEIKSAKAVLSFKH
jgi:ribosome maturation factor RimP